MERFTQFGTVSSRHVLLLCVLWLAGCVSQPPAEIVDWVSDESSGCRSVAANLAVNGRVLQSIVGPNFVVEVDPASDLGSLTIEILSCESSNSSRALIDLDASQVPIAIVGIDMWDSYILHVSNDDNSLTRFMKDNHVVVMDGRSKLQDDGEGGLNGTISFENGEVRMIVPQTCSMRPFEHRRTIVGTGTERFSLLFGGESGHACKPLKIQVEFSGETPFSDLDLDLDSASAEYREGIAWNLTVWRGANLGLN